MHMRAVFVAMWMAMAARLGEAERAHAQQQARH
jgi:hypothetical protein